MTIEPLIEAAEKGHQEILWLFKGKVLETGSSNIFFVFKKGPNL